jgi:hypothetical protein
MTASRTPLRSYDVTRAVAKHLIVLAVLLTIPAYFHDASVVLAQDQKRNYLWDGWHATGKILPIHYKVFHDKVVALSNLSEGCDPGHSFSFEGKIAKVNFDNQGTIIENEVATSAADQIPEEVAHHPIVPENITLAVWPYLKELDS